MELWYTDRAAAKQRHGLTASWDTSEITDSRLLFADISLLDALSVTDMSDTLYMSSVTDTCGMLEGATSFIRDLSQRNVLLVR